MLARFAKTLTPLPAHPLYLLILSLGLGIAWQATRFSLLIPLIIGLVIGLLFVPSPKNLKKYIPVIVTALAIFFIGALRYQQRIDNFDDFYYAVGRRPVNLVARVIDCEPSYKQPGACVATLEIESAGFVVYKKPRVDTNVRSCPSIHFSYRDKPFQKNTQDERFKINSVEYTKIQLTNGASDGKSEQIQRPAHPPFDTFSRWENTQGERTRGRRVPVSGQPDLHITGHRLITILSGPAPFQVGDTISLKNIFFFPPKAKTDYWRYLIKSGIVAHLRTKPESFTLVKHPKRSFRRTISELRNNILESAKKQLSPHAFALFTSIFWGKHAVDQKQLNQIREDFRPWGILHYLARAGLHVTMLIILLEKTISLLPIPFMIRTVLGAVLIGGYALLSWSSISFVRAILVFFIFIFCTLLWAPSHGLYRLVLACFLILLSNPLQLFFLDFQLSFLVTAIFMWMSAITKAQNS